MQYLTVSILSNVFVNVCRGLFEDNKLTFSFLIATSFQLHSKERAVGDEGRERTGKTLTTNKNK